MANDGGAGTGPQDAEQLFASFRARVDRGEAIDFEAFCAGHPALADPLRRLYRAWLTGADPSLASSRIRSIRDFLDRKIHPEARPGVDLDPEAPADPPSGVTERLSELANRSGRYEPRAEVGRGGMGVILKVWDKDLRRTLAMKASFHTVDPEAKPGEELRSSDLHMVSRFLEEAQITGQLDHPGIVPVHELGVDSDGRLFFTMRLVQGRSLDEIFRHARLEKEGWNRVRALNAMVRVCEALAYAHSKGVIHRDIKPANIMVGKFGEVYVMDWGLAKVLGRPDDAQARARAHPQASLLLSRVRTDRAEDLRKGPSSELLTMQGAIIGTPPFMPPEQAEGRIEELDPRADVYSVGALLYTLLAGQMPFIRKGELVTVADVIERMVGGPPEPIPHLDESVPAELVAICDKAMARDRDDRYPSMEDLAEDLRAYLERRVVKAYETGAFAEFKKWVVRNRGMAAAIAALLLVGVVSATWVTIQQRVRIREVSAAQELTERARARAESSMREAVTSAEAARVNAERAEWQGYLARLAGAQASLRLDETGEAKALLAGCADRFRGWEWRFLRAATDTSLRVMAGHREKVTAVAFSPDGARVASGSTDKSVRLWSAGTGDELLVLPGAPDAVTALAFSPDGTRIAAASQDLLVHLWDAQAGRPLGTLPGVDAVVGALAFSPDGARLAGAMEETVAVWQVDTFQRLATVEHDEPVGAVAFADADRLLLGSESGVQLRRADGGDPVWTAESEEPVLCVAARGSWAAYGSDDTEAHLLDLRTGEERMRLQGHEDPVVALAFLENGARLATGSLDGTIRVWSTAGGVDRAIAVLRGHDDAVLALDAAADGTLVSGSADGTLRTWRVGEGEPVVTLRGDEDFLSAIAFSPDGDSVAATSAGHGEIRVWDPSTGAEVRYIPEQGGGRSSLAWSEDGKWIAAGGEEDATARIVDARTGEEHAVLEGHLASVSAVAFSPDGATLATGSADKTVRVWSVAGKVPVGEARAGHEARITSVAFHPDGGRLLTASFDRTVRVWDLADAGAAPRVVGEHPSAVLAAVWSRDGARIVTGCADGTIRVFDAETGELAAEPMHGHAGAVTCLAFSPDGSRLVSGGHDKTLRLWNGDSGEALLRIDAHEGWVTGVVFSPDGARIASCSFDTTARVWSAGPR